MAGPGGPNVAKKWYQYLVTREGASVSPAAESGPPAETVAEIAAAVPEELPLAPIDGVPSFAAIYAAAQIEPPSHGYSILKVADMLQNEHIAALPVEVKRKSVLVALDAAGVAVNDVIQDAVKRDRALDTFERTQQKSLEALETRVRAEKERLQREIDALIVERQSKIQQADAELARETAAVNDWRQRKQAEEQRIADAVGHFAAENPITTSSDATQDTGRTR
jgi:hypothetical protein